MDICVLDPKSRANLQPSGEDHGHLALSTTNSPRGDGSCSPSVVTLGSVILDLHVVTKGTRVGNKCDAEIHATLGGSAVNCAQFPKARGIPTTAIGVQQAGLWAAGCREEAARRGLRLVLCERRETAIAMSVIVPNGATGENDIYVQRLTAPEPDELPREAVDSLHSASAVIVGPLRDDPHTHALLNTLPELAPRAFRALIPHASLIRHDQFASIAGRFNYVQMNAEESKLLPEATSDIRANARLLSSQVCQDDRTSCAVTNGRRLGWLWAEQRCWEIRPVRLSRVVDTTGCGDTFCSALITAWRLCGCALKDAIGVAVRAAAGVATEVGVGALAV